MVILPLFERKNRGGNRCRMDEMLIVFLLPIVNCSLDSFGVDVDVDADADFAAGGGDNCVNYICGSSFDY